MRKTVYLKMSPQYVEKPTEGLLGLRGHWVPVTAARSLPHSKMTRFRPKLMRPQPTAILPGAMPGCLRNPGHTLLHERTWGIEPGGQLKHREGCREKDLASLALGAEFRRDFHTVLPT